MVMYTVPVVIVASVVVTTGIVVTGVIVETDADTAVVVVTLVCGGVTDDIAAAVTVVVVEVCVYLPWSSLTARDINSNPVQCSCIHAANLLLACLPASMLPVSFLACLLACLSLRLKPVHASGGCIDTPDITPVLENTLY